MNFSTFDLTAFIGYFVVVAAVFAVSMFLEFLSQ